MQYRVLAEKLKEAAASVLPVTAIVAVLCYGAGSLLGQVEKNLK